MQMCKTKSTNKRQNINKSMISSTKNRDTKQNKPQHQGVRKFFTSDGKQTKKQAETS